MLKKTLYILLVIFCQVSFGQSFLNGNFEFNSAGIDRINLTNFQYNNYMTNSIGFGNFAGGGVSGGNIDIIGSAAYCGTAQSGNWFVALTSGGTDALSLELSSPLIAGKTYTLTFYDRSCSPWSAGSPVQIGVSNLNNNFGSLVYTAPTPLYGGGWTQRTFSFTAPISALYITVTCGGINSIHPWTQIDNFSICSANLNLGTDTTLCEGQTIILNGGSATSYLWSNGANTSSISISNSGTYWLQTTNGQCLVRDSINIIFDTAPNIYLGNDSTLCQGQSVILNGGAASSYTWSNGANTSSISVSNSGTYWLQATNGQCVKRDSINIIFNTTPNINLGNDSILCEGQTIILNGGSATSYLWSNGANTSSISVSNSGTYWLTATIGQCAGRDSINIIFDTVPNINLGNDSTLCQGQSVILNGGAASSYTWSNGANTSSISVSNSGFYWLTATNGQCADRDSINIIFNTDCEIEIEMPNIFTPNNDGANDLFKPSKYKGISNAELVIYNRWGEQLFQTDKTLNGWNGYYKENVCNDGTYYWILRYRTILDETKTITGFLTLIK